MAPPTKISQQLLELRQSLLKALNEADGLQLALVAARVSEALDAVNAESARRLSADDEVAHDAGQSLVNGAGGMQHPQ